MNVHLKFTIIFFIMGLVVFGSCFIDKGDSQHFNIPTISFMMFHDIFTIPLMFAAFTFGLAMLLYGLSYWWGKYTFKLITSIRQDFDKKE